MQEIIQSFLSELHAAYFKQNGWRKTRHRFRRELDGVLQQIEFQSSQWNSAGSAVRFYVNVSVGFADIPFDDGLPELTGRGRIDSLLSEAPTQFDLTSANRDEIRRQLLSLIPAALRELPRHYEDVRSRAQAGLYCPIPLPDA